MARAGLFRDAGQRKSGDMFSDLGDLGFADFEIGIQPFNDRLALQEIMTLTHHADAERDSIAGRVKLAASQFAEGRNEKFIAKRADMLFDQFVERAGRIGHFASHQSPFPSRPIRIEQVLKEMVDQATEAFFRRIGRLSHGVTPGRSSRASIHHHPV